MEIVAPVVEYNISDGAIALLREEYGGLTADTPSNYRLVVQAIADCRDRRVAVEKKRKELKADALEFGRRVDSEAKRLTSMLWEIEEPLKQEKQKVDDEKARIKREKEEAERAAIEAELAAKRAAEEAAAKAEQERIRKEQEAEAARLAEERRKIEAERAAQEARLAEERAAIEKERRRLAQEQFERESKERAEREAREKLAREAEEKKRAEELAEIERKRQAQMAPDKDKLAVLRVAIREIEPPAVISPEAKACLAAINDLLNEAAETIERFLANA